MRDDAVKRHKQENTSNRREQNPRIEHLNTRFDQASGLAYSQLKFPTSAGTGKIVVPRASLMKPRELYATLLNHDAVLPMGKDVESGLAALERAIAQEPRLRLEYVAMTGWQSDFGAFATPTRVTVGERCDRRLLPPRRGDEATRPAAPRGNFQRWISEVAEPCCQSTIGTLLLALGFTAPLLQLTNRPIFGINLFGRSKAGKSTLLLAAGSISGAQTEADLPNFATTEAAIGETCRFHNGTLLPLNEVGLIRGERKTAYKTIRPCIFQLTEGREYQRHSKSGYATAAHLSKSHLVFVSTAEHPMSYYAAQARERQDDGEIARCIDLPLLRVDHPDVMDRNCKRLTTAQRQDRSRGLLMAIRTGCARNGGAMPILYFARRIMADPSATRQEVMRLARRFVDQVTDSDYDDVDHHRAMCFGLTAAAGRLACRWGILPMTEEMMVRIVRYYCKSARRQRNRDQDVLREARETLRRNLLALPFERDVNLDEVGYEGFIRREDGGHRYIVKESNFREWFSDHPAKYSLIMASLIENHEIVPVRGRVYDTEQEPRHSHTITWPNQKLTRCYIIRFY